MWVVSLSVPTSLRATLRNRQGKPLARLERSTGERDEARARRAYPKLLAELEGELLQKSRDAGVETTIQAAVERAVGKIYQDVVEDAKSLSSVTALGRHLQSSDATLAAQIAIKNSLLINKIDPQEEIRKKKAFSRIATWAGLRSKGLDFDINGAEHFGLNLHPSARAQQN